MELFISFSLWLNLCNIKVRKCRQKQLQLKYCQYKNVEALSDDNSITCKRTEIKSYIGMLSQRNPITGRCHKKKVLCQQKVLLNISGAALRLFVLNINAKAGKSGYCYMPRLRAIQFWFPFPFFRVIGGFSGNMKTTDTV